MFSNGSDGAVTPLQRLRLERGWKQSRVILALIEQARVRGMRIAGPASLKTMLSRWENGSGQPDKVYRQLFCAIYGCEPEDLGPAGGKLEHGVSVGPAPTPDAETVGYFRSVLDLHIRADNLVGPKHLLDVVRAQAAVLDDVLRVAKASVRQQVLVLACWYNEFAGWIYQDAGDPANAMLFSNRAMDYAMGIGDPADTTYLLMRKSNIASDLGSPDRALGLADAALREGSHVPAKVRALVLIQQARAHAVRGEAEVCARSLDLAMREITRPPAQNEKLGSYCTPSYLAMYAASCWMELGQSDRAVTLFESALSGWPAFLRRDRGLCLTRLATAYASCGDKVSACRAGREAATAVGRATSVRALRELRRLPVHLAPWRRDEEVSELSCTIKQLTTVR